MMVRALIIYCYPLFAIVHIRGVVGLQAALQTDLTLRRDWFHT
jgi:hypothetical protein